MALDTKQKRGSVIALSLPTRQWLAEPSGDLPVASRISLLRFTSAVGVFAIRFDFLHGTAFSKPSLLGKITFQPLLGGDIVSTANLGGRVRSQPEAEGIIDSSPSLTNDVRINP